MYVREEDNTWDKVAAVLFLAAVGVLFYFLIRKLNFGGNGPFGFGSGSGGNGGNGSGNNNGNTTGSNSSSANRSATSNGDATNHGSTHKPAVTRTTGVNAKAGDQADAKPVVKLWPEQKSQVDKLSDKLVKAEHDAQQFDKKWGSTPSINATLKEVNNLSNVDFIDTVSTWLHKIGIESPYDTALAQYNIDAYALRSEFLTKIAQFYGEVKKAQ